MQQIEPRLGGCKAYPQSFGSTEFRLERPQPHRDMSVLRVARRDHHVSDFRVFVRWGSGRVDPKFRSFSDQKRLKKILVTYGVVVLLQQTTLSNTDTGEYEPGKEPAQIGTFLVVNGT
mgnify:CR=1 FL=1